MSKAEQNRVGRDVDAEMDEEASECQRPKPEYTKEEVAGTTDTHFHSLTRLGSSGSSGSASETSESKSLSDSNSAS